MKPGAPASLRPGGSPGADLDRAVLDRAPGSGGPVPTYVHATAVVLGECGILIRGASGSGKTSLALALLADARWERTFASLVGDDRVALWPAHGRLIARPHPSIAGLVERRGVGILRCAHEAACVLGMVVDLVDGPDALPDRCPTEEPTASLLGVKFRVLTLLSGDGARENSRRVWDALPDRGAAPITECF